MSSRSSFFPLRRAAVPAGYCAVALAAGLSLPAQAQTPASSGQAAPGGVVQMPAITVGGAAVEDNLIVHPNAPVNTGALGSRTQLETPFSTTVVTSADMQERNVAKLGEVFATDASVSDNSAAYGAWASYISVRGLPLDWQNSFRIDGKPFLSYVTVLPLDHMEQVELLKGSSGFMYGFGSPGGLVNYVTRKPTDEPLRAIELGYVSKGLLREHVDLGGRAGNNGIFGYRLNATHEEGNTYNGGSLYRDSVSLALDARLTERLTWDFQSIYQDRKAVGQEATITGFALPPHGLPSPVRNDDRTLIGKGTYADNEFRFYSTGLKYQLAPEWTLSTNYSYSTTDTRRNEAVFNLLDSAGNYTDDRSDYGEAYSFNYWQAMVEGRFATGPLRHHVVLGGSWQKQKNDYSSNGVYIPGYGTGSLRSSNRNTYYSQGRLDLYRAAEITQKALFVSDTVDLTDRWSVLAGIRYTDYSQDGFAASGAGTSSYDRNGVPTPTLALMYKITPQTMTYASYIESLEPGSTVSDPSLVNFGELLDPLKSRQYELGIKTSQDGWAATAALFRIERKSEFANDERVFVQDGESIYQGLELAASSRLGRSWNLGGSVMVLDSEYKRSAGVDGNRVAGAPRFIAAAQLAYHVPAVPGLKLHADVKYTGDTELRRTEDLKVPGYAIFNVGATYDTRIHGYDTTLRAGIGNLGNKRYWLYQTDNYVKAGDPRIFAVSASVRF